MRGDDVAKIIWKASVRWALVLGLAGVIPACVAAGAAAAGVGGGMYFTSRGAESMVDSPIQQVENRARAVLEQEGVAITGTQTEQSGNKRELKGKKGELDISVTMDGQGSQTKTEVSARKNLVTWDKDYAQQILSRIVKPT
jgi:protein-tyrosine-phosphatase